MEQKSNRVNTSWLTHLLTYFEAAVASGIPEKTAEWYVNGSQRLAISIKGKTLGCRSVNDIGGFMKEWTWQYVFPATRLFVDVESGNVRAIIFMIVPSERQQEQP